MSNPGDSTAQAEREALKGLDRAVGKVLGHVQGLRARVEDAEARAKHLQELLHRFTDDPAAAGRLLARLGELEAENSDLRSRLARGREGVERMLARLRFLEEQR